MIGKLQSDLLYIISYYAVEKPIIIKFILPMRETEVHKVIVCPRG